MLDRELVEAVRLAREAGAILMEIYATDFAVHYKDVATGDGAAAGQTNPVTEADRRANELIVRKLREAFPRDGIVAEETTDQSDAMRKGRCWYVDPLDGTKEFISKNGEFSVMIGLAVDGQARLGVVYKPVGDVLYRGVVGDSAFREVGAMTYALGVTDRTTPSELRLVVSRSHRSPSTDAFARKLGITHERSSGSVGLKVGLIAEREADLYVHLSPHSYAWDACAPEAVLRAAGGVLTDLSGARLVYGGEDLQNKRGLLAVNSGATLEAVLEAAKEVASLEGLLPASESAAVEGDAPTDAEAKAAAQALAETKVGPSDPA